MSGVTLNTPATAPRLTDALVLEAMALHQRAATGVCTAEDHLAMAARLGAALAAKKAALAGNGGVRAGSGRPKNWYAVQDADRPEPMPTQDLAVVAEYFGLAEASLKVYMARNDGKHTKNKETDHGTVEIWVRRCGAAELAWIADNPGFTPWAPVQRKRDPKKLAR